MKVYLTYSLGFLLALLLGWGFLGGAIALFAASSDATLLSGTQITANGITVTVKQSGVESLTVNSGDFSAIMPAGSALYITSADKKSFTVSPANRVESSTCNASTSELVVVGPIAGENSVTVTITPSSTTCTGGGGGVVSSGGGGGGVGGGGASVAVTSTAPAPAASPVAVVATAVSSELRQIVELFIALGIIPADKAEKARSVLAQQVPAVSGTFSRALGKGTSHADVKRLQQLLNSDSDTRVVSIGAGSPGSESQFFGALTEKAVQKFQVKYGIAKTGEPGYGFVGPKTRAKLKEAFGQ